MNKGKQFERESVIGRIVEFLRLYPPFNIMAEADLLMLASQTSISYFDKGEYIFKAGDALHTQLYLVRKGEVRIVASEGELVDICSEGQLFGARALMASEHYMASAIADPEALIVKFPIEEIRKIIARDGKLTEFFFGDFSSGVALRKRKLSEINKEVLTFSEIIDHRFNFKSNHLTRLRTPVTCTPQVKIREAAEVMRSKGVGSIIIVSQNSIPVGIITDTDLRNKVATGEFDVNLPVDQIMNSPVKTVVLGKSSEEYMLEMIRMGVHHLCVTHGGQANEPLIGVITDHDLLLSRGNNAAVLVKELRKSSSNEERVPVVRRFDEHIKNLALHDFPVLDIAGIVQGFNRELLNCLINEELKRSPGISQQDFCWLALGSTAREEQIIRTDFDSALILADHLNDQKELMHTITERVYSEMIALGYSNDKAGIQANNPQWILTHSEWKEKFRSWMHEPTEKALLNATIFFDLMPFYGNQDLASDLQNHIYQVCKGNQRFIAFLAQNALKNPPPLGFFKNLLLEKSGEHKNSFDIKARAMMPLADAARLQSLELNSMFPSNTVERFHRLEKLDEVHASRYEDCAVAYEIFMRIRAVEGLKHDHDGRFVDPSHLSPLEKQLLKKAFEPISSIQHLIKPL